MTKYKINTEIQYVDLPPIRESNPGHCVVRCVSSLGVYESVVLYIKPFHQISKH